MTNHMAKTDFCRGCSKQNSGSSVMCVCGKQNVCDDCTNTTVCQECGNSCCKSCSFKVWCCGLVLCHAGNTQSCFSKHFTTRPCGHYGCNDQEECFKCHPEVTEEQVEAKKVASPEHPVASTKAPMEVSPPTARRPRRTVRSIYKRGEPMEEAESKKVKKRVKCDTEKVLPASSGNKQTTSKPDKPVTHVIMTSTKCFFPQNLHAMITEIANVEPAVVSWIQGGEAFMIHDEMSAKLGEAMKKHFRRKFSNVKCYNLFVHQIFLLCIYSPWIVVDRFQVYFPASATQQLWLYQASQGKVSSCCSLSTVLKRWNLCSLIHISYAMPTGTKAHFNTNHSIVIDPKT